MTTRQLERSRSIHQKEKQRSAMHNQAQAWFSIFGLWKGRSPDALMYQKSVRKDRRR
jgi:hypothetical protein